MNDLKKLAADDFQEVILSLMQTPAEFNATCARTAMKDGDKTTIYQVIIPLSGHELKAMKVAYENSTLIL